MPAKGQTAFEENVMQCMGLRTPIGGKRAVGRKQTNMMTGDSCFGSILLIAPSGSGT